MADTMITATPDTGYETRARSELMLCIAVKLGLSSPITLAHYANCPLDKLWWLALALHGRTRSIPFLSLRASICCEREGL